MGDHLEQLAEQANVPGEVVLLYRSMAARRILQTGIAGQKLAASMVQVIEATRSHLAFMGKELERFESMLQESIGGGQLMEGQEIE